MPTVRKGTRSVSTAALPGARLTAAETGASLGKRPGSATTQALTGLGNAALQIGADQYQRITREEKQRADQVAILDAGVALDRWELDRLHDTEHGALNTRGKASFGLPESIDEDFAKETGRIEKGLGNDDQKLAFAKMKAERGANVAMTVRRHVAGEMRTYEVETLKATTDNAHNLAILHALDPRRVGVELQKGVEALTTSLPRLGVTGEALDAQVRDFRSGVHVGVVNNLLANEQTRAAKVYFEETKSQIDGDVVDDVERAIRTGDVKGQAQKETARILASGGTLTEQRAAAKAIEDPDVQDEVLHRIEHESDVKDKQTRDDDEVLFRGVYDTIDKTKSIETIPANVWAKMNGAERSAARGYARALAKGEPVETDSATYYALMQQAMDDPTTFATLNMMKARNRLDDGDFKQLAGLQLSIRNAARSAEGKNEVERQLDSVRSQRDILNSSLERYGVDPKADSGTPDAKATAELARVVDKRIVAEQQPDASGKRREISNERVQQIVDEALSAQATRYGTIWGTLWHPFTYDFTDKTRRLIDTTINDIPPAERTAIETSLRTRGLPISDPVIVDTYINGQLRLRRK